jgi:hypothetical protein
MAALSVRISQAMKLLGQLGSGEDPTDDEYDDALIRVNALLDSWRNEFRMTYALQEETLTLSDGDSAYSVGPSGDLNTTRPLEIEAAWIVEDDVSYPVRVIQDDEYILIPDKTTEADWPDRLLYRPSMSTGTLLVYPVPNATRTLKLLTRIPISTFTAVTDTVAFPPGWDRAIDFNLAIEIAPMFETEPSATIINMARESKANIKRANLRALKIVTDLSKLMGYPSGNIVTG